MNHGHQKRLAQRIPPSEYHDDYWLLNHHLNRERFWRNHLLWIQHLGVINWWDITHTKKKWTLIVDPIEREFRRTESLNHHLMETVFHTLMLLVRRRRERRREITILQSKGAIIEDYDVKKKVLDELNELGTIIEKTFVYAGKEEVIDEEEDYVRLPERRPRNDYWGWEEDYWAEDNWEQREHDREDAFRRQGD
jgi:hypothetical protein